MKCQAYAKFPAGVTGGPNDPCTPAADFQLSAKSDPVCSLMCVPGYEQKGGDGISTLTCGVDGKLTGEMNCTDIDECKTANGGCFFKSNSLLRQCVNADGGRVCGDCPKGYTKNGDAGCSEMKCQAYAKFPAGVTGGPNDPCTPAADFQLSAKSDPVCSLMCAPGYEQKGGDGISTLKCGVDGKLTGEMNCTDIDECKTDNGGCFFKSNSLLRQCVNA